MLRILYVFFRCRSHVTRSHTFGTLCAESRVLQFAKSSDNDVLMCSMRWRQFLPSKDIASEWPTNGTETLSAVWLNSSDIIVPDVMMPGMNGITFLRVLKAQPMLRTIPVILVSAINLPQGLPAQGFLRKPFSATALMDFINRPAP
jgi:CheY-like chemotaxis protein